MLARLLVAIVPRRARSERGQTLPFWIVAVLVSLGLTFFAFNYANSVRWQIRAQNAADSAAAVMVGQDAAVANSVASLTYALQIQNLRNRSLQNEATALTSNLTSDTSCQNLLATQCVADYVTLSGKLANNEQAYANGVSQVGMFVGGLTDNIGNQASIDSTLNSQLFGSGDDGVNSVGCVRLNTDCGFRYTAGVPYADPLNGGQIEYEVWTCRVVPTAVPDFLQVFVNTISNRGRYFYAIGHAAVELGPASDNPLNPGTNLNAATGLPDQPPENLDPGLSGSASPTSFAGLNLQTGYLVPKPAPPHKSLFPISVLCPPLPKS